MTAAEIDALVARLRQMARHLTEGSSFFAAEFVHMSNAMEQAAAAIASLRDQLASADTLLIARCKQVDALRDQLGKAQQVFASQQSDIGALGYECEQAHGVAQACERRAEKAEDERDTFKRVLAAEGVMANRLEKAEAELAEARSVDAYMALKLANDDLRIRAEKAEGELAKLDVILTERVRELNEAQRRIAELERLTEPGQIDWAARCGRLETELEQRSPPREPTQAMIEAGRRMASDENDCCSVQDIWRAMYDAYAAPQTDAKDKT